MLTTSLMLACLLWQQSGLTPAPLQDVGPATVEVRCVDLAGETLHGVEWRYVFEDAHDRPIPDERSPGGSRQGMRFDDPPRPEQVDRALRGREWSSLGDGPRIELQPERSLLVEARRKDSWGYLWLPRDWRTTTGRAHAEGTPLSLELAPDWDLRVRVEDASGRPTKAVQIGLRCEELRFDERWAPNPEEYVFAHVGHGARRARDPILVRIHELLDPPVEARIDPHRAPDGPVVLRMPATGAVELRVRRTEERRRLDMTVSLLLEGKAAGSARLREGVARFEHVGLGLQLTARLQAGVADRRVKLEGPRWAGELVTLELEEPVPLPQPAEEPSPFESGHASEVVPAATVSGFLLLDPAIPLDQIDIRAGDPSRGLNHGPLLERDGKFEFTLPAGQTRFEVRPKGIQEFTAPELKPVFHLDAVLEPGKNEIAALSAIDLRGKFFAHTVRLEGSADVRIHSARVLFGPRSWPRTQRGYCWLTQPPLTVVSLWPRIDLELYLPGYRAIELYDLERERTVVPEPGIPVELRLVCPTLPEPPWRLAAVLQPPERLMRVNDWDAPAFDDHRRVRTTAFRPGVNQIVWLLLRPGGGSSYVTTEPQVVNVLESSVPQVFTLELPPEELARWLAERR